MSKSLELLKRRARIGEIPTGWKLTSVGTACVIRNEQRTPISSDDRAASPGEYPYYGPTGVLDHISEFRYNGRFALIGEDGDHFIKYVEKDQTLLVEGEFSVNNHAHVIASTADCSAEWFAWYFRHRSLRDLLTRQGASRYKLTKEALQSLPMLLPPASEQSRITGVLHTWDAGIQTSEQLKSLAKVRFSALQNSLFGTTAIRTNRWKTASLAQIAERVLRKTDGGEHPIMTISGKHGFLRQDEKFNRYMAGVSVENYTLLQAGEFAYNKGNSKTYPQGCIYRLEQDTGLVPHVYISFRLRAGLNSDFYAALFHSGILNRQLARLINSGVRNDGLLNLNIEDFFGCEVPVPPIDQQVRISDTLRTAKREIEILDRQIGLMESQKRGLMQKLLTGEWRVPVRDGDVDAMAARVTEEAAQ
jgi:type I restriction enzyme, S subunit